MQTCSLCNTQSADTVAICPNCGADLREKSNAMVALKAFQDNPRVKNVRLVVAHDACPACKLMEGSYDKHEAPSLPVLGCSHENGCRCFFEPMLDEIYP